MVSIKKIVPVVSNFPKSVFLTIVVDPNTLNWDTNQEF